MIRLYPIVIMIQVFCMYHAYSNRSAQKWLWIILFFPVIGSLIYLYNHFYNRRNIENIKEEVRGSFIKNYTIDKLEQKVEFSDTFSNKLELADEHLTVGNFDRAIEILESCKVGTHKDDVYLNMKLLQSYYLKENFEKVLEYGKLLTDKKEFINSPQRIAFAWSSYHLGEIDEANKIFSNMDTQYSNYGNRLEYSYFLQDTKGDDHAQIKIEELLEEIQKMDSYEKRLNKKVIQEIRYLNRQLSR